MREVLVLNESYLIEIHVIIEFQYIFDKEAPTIRTGFYNDDKCKLYVSGDFLFIV